MASLISAMPSRQSPWRRSNEVTQAVCACGARSYSEKEHRLAVCAAADLQPAESDSERTKCPLATQAASLCSDSRPPAISSMISTMSDKPSKLKIADREFTSRLLVGTGKFGSNELMRDALVASGTEIVTVALRRADISGRGDPFANILDFVDPKRFLVLPNTSGARNSAEAVRLARLAAAAGLPTWVKLEIHPDPRYLLPDPVETLAAAEILLKEGFTVLPYINADPVLAKRLQDVGTATVMPLGSPIGSNRGI